MLELEKECIILDLKAPNKEQVLRELSQTIADTYTTLNKDQVFSAFAEREQMGSTGIGRGVAIPHGKISKIDNIILCFGRSSQGIMFEAIDNRPVYLFCVLLAPLHVASQYLKSLAHIATFFKEEANRIKLTKTVSSEEVIKLLTTIQS